MSTPTRRRPWTSTAVVSAALAAAAYGAGCGDQRSTSAGAPARRDGALDAMASSSPSSGAAAPAFDFPAVPGWEREEPRPLGNEPGFSLGYNLRSSVGPIAATIFVYKRGLAHLPNGASSAAVSQELDDALSGIQQLVQMKKTYRSAEVKTRDKATIGAGPGSVEFQRVVVDASYFDRPPTVSSILLTAAKDHFVKIRITQPGKEAEAEERALRPLLEAVGRALR